MSLTMALSLLADSPEPSFWVRAWPIAPPVILGAVAIYLLLPRPRTLPPVWGSLCAALALLSAGWLLIWGKTASPETVLFYAFSALAVGSGGLLVTQRNPVHAALSFALVVLSTCGLFLLQAAPFLMAATVIVYAGAIVVTFLFVIMLAQQAGISSADHRSREPLFSSIAGFVLVGALLYLLSLTYDTQAMDRVLAHLDVLVWSTDPKAHSTSANDFDALLSDQQMSTLFEALEEEARDHSGLSDSTRLDAALGRVRTIWLRAREKEINAKREELRPALVNLQSVARQFRNGFGNLQPHGDKPERFSEFSGPPPNKPLHDLPRDAQGRVAMPADNVGALGRSLFTDFLVPVELGGTLLLVATIGAIAITNRRKEGFR
jgi:NADH:ubiquinone oxidoreductase subunit 6 (subunit J)